MVTEDGLSGILNKNQVIKGDTLVKVSPFLVVMWLALNVEKDIPRNELNQSYTHIAFSIEEAEFDKMYEKLRGLNVNMLSGRPRDERDKKSIYFTKPRWS
jgi:hypothetical protein